MNAESGNVDTVLIAGRVAKRHGQLTFPAQRIDTLKDDLAEMRWAPRGLPGRWGC